MGRRNDVPKGLTVHIPHRNVGQYPLLRRVMWYAEDVAVTIGLMVLLFFVRIQGYKRSGNGVH